MGNDVQQTFADIDTMDADTFLRHLHPEVRFTFGNLDPVHGHEGVRAAVDGFWATIGGLKHHLHHSWDVEDDTTVVHADVEYTRQDGTVVTVPNIDILHWRDGTVDDWRIVIDLAPLYA